jgi:hypothetical protein
VIKIFHSACRDETLVWIPHFPVSFLPFAFGKKQQTDLVQTVQQFIEASCRTSLRLLLPALYPPTKCQFYFASFVVADKNVVPDRHNKPKTYNL